MPRPQDRILVPLRGSFQNFQRTPPSFYTEVPPPQGYILQLLHYANNIRLNLPSVTSLPLSWDHLLLFHTRRKRVTLKCSKSKFLQNKVQGKILFSLPTWDAKNTIHAHVRCLLLLAFWRLTGSDFRWKIAIHYFKGALST